MKIIRSVFLIINYKTFIVTILSIFTTWICFRYDFKANFPLTLVGIAIVFPVVFSIDSAYKRREKALHLMADFKTHCFSLYLAARDWVEGDHHLERELKAEMIAVYAKLKTTFLHYKPGEGIFEKEIYPMFSDLSKSSMKFRDIGLQPGEVSRVSQYLSKLQQAVENLKVILDYRTPLTLRAYSRIFIYSFPILYAPYFVYVSHEYTSGIEYMMPIVFSFILVSLDNIQDHLEDPFDQVGEDDIRFDTDEFEAMMK